MQFIVTSVIDYPKKKLSYSETRSTFNVKERLEQTKETLRSIQCYVPDASVIFVELGLTDYATELRAAVPGLSMTYLYRGNRRFTSVAVRSAFKGLGETIGMLHALSYIKKSELCFKLSGRYELTNTFATVPWDNTTFNFKDTGYGLSTRLYAFPASKKFIFSLLLLSSIPLLLLNISIERIYKLFIPSFLITKQPVLGVRGQIGVNGNVIEE